MAQKYPYGPPALVQSQQASSPARFNTDAPYQFDHQGFPVQLVWSGNLMGAIAYRRQITALPGRNPASDPTIAIFGIRMFTIGNTDQVSGHRVESTCRILFASIMSRCEIGYSGDEKTNRLIKLGNGNRHQQVDVDCTCQIRIDNVIRVLNEWKSACKDVAFSDEKIENLANAPATVWQDKFDQKNNNISKKANRQHERGTIATKTDANIQRNDNDDYKPLPRARQPRRPRRKNQPAADNTGVDPSQPPALADNNFSDPQQRTGQQEKRGGQGNKATAAVESPVASPPGSQSQMYASSAASQYPAVGPTAAKPLLNSKVLANISKQQMDEFDTWSDPFRTFYPIGGVGGLPEDPPAYDSPNFSGHPQQGQQFVNPYARPSAPSSNQQLPPQQVPVQSYGVQGFGMAQPASHGFDGNGQGRFPQGLAPQGLVPVHYSNHFHGPNSLGGLNYWSNPYGNFASAAASGFGNNYGSTPNSSAMPDTFDGGLMSEVPHATNAENPPSQSARSFNPAAKHWRTPTMDQELQPKPTRVKRGESHNDESPGLRQVDEE